jgi:meiotically up-regulated gene 157 (Mug157) protein
MQLAMDIAVLNAKTTLADRINGRLSSKTKNFISRIGSNDLDAAVAMDIQRVTTNLIADVDVAGYAVEKSKVVQDGPQYRAYVLLAYSDKEANKILINRLRKERMLLDKLQATNAYKDLEESVALKKEQDLNEMETIVKGLSQ